MMAAMSTVMGDGGGGTLQRPLLALLSASPKPPGHPRPNPEPALTPLSASGPLPPLRPTSPGGGGSGALSPSQGGVPLWVGRVSGLSSRVSKGK